MSTDAIETILGHERGYVDHPADRGGPTKFGITQATLSAWLGRPATKQDVKDLTIDTARAIYDNRYLTSSRIDMLPEPPQGLMLDMAINHGPVRAIKILQKTLNLVGDFGTVSVDGIIGRMTIGVTIRAASAMGNYLQNALVEERIKFYHAIVDHDPTQRVFLKGWLRRANSYKLPV